MVWSCDSYIWSPNMHTGCCLVKTRSRRQHKNKNIKNKPNKKKNTTSVCVCVCARSIVLAHICSETRQWTSHRLHNGFVDKSPSEWAPDAFWSMDPCCENYKGTAKIHVTSCHQIAVRPKLKTLTLRGSGHSCLITPMVCTPPSRCTLETAW